MKKTKIFLLFVLMMFFGLLENISASPTVTYISSEGFYINGGTNYDLKKDDTLIVMRKDVLIATCIIKNISKKSSACVILEKSGELQIGDQIIKSNTSALVLIKPKEKDGMGSIPTKKKMSDTSNRLSGYYATQHYITTDMSNSSLSSYQPSVRTKLKIDNLFSKKMKLHIKHRSRYYNRSSNQNIMSSQDNWSHRLYEFAIYSTDKLQSIQYSFGRQSIYQMRGIGFVDGLYLGKSLNKKVKIGTAIGLEPDNLNQKINFKRKKAGLFLAYTMVNKDDKKILLSAALAGSYISSDINREYLYLQADYTSTKLSINQFAELDYYRSIRKEAFDKSFSFTSYYGRVNYNLNPSYSFYISYDTRERVLYLEDSYSSDTLFDDNNNRGIKMGARLRPKQNLSISINGGVRTRSNSFADNKYASISVSAFHFPRKRSSLTIRFSYLETMFTTGYRPSMSFRFPIQKRMYMTVSGTTNIYASSTGNRSTSYVDAQTYYTFSNNYFISISDRQYIEKELQSNQLFFELGKHF